MQRLDHSLVSNTPGTVRTLTSLHFGPKNSGRKAYLQAALHADEPPGMLVAAKLQSRLDALEREGRLLGEIVLVPVANPIGLAQWIDHSHIGRFDLRTAENFNRHYPDPSDDAARQLEGRLGQDAAENVAQIRAALKSCLERQPAATELASLRKTLLTLAIDADVALDLHCDAEALMHLYTATPSWPEVEPLARYLGARASLLEMESGDFPFDEACSRPWWKLQQRFPGCAIPVACTSVTVEFRGTQDVSHASAARDAEALLDYLTHRGLVDGTPSPMPPLLAPATPLAGSEPIVASGSGIVVFRAELGCRMKPGDVVVDLVDPITGDTTPLKAGTEGILYARENRRFAHAGMRLAKIAGAQAYRTGNLLSE